MAGSDYYSCDRCEAKTFYDAELFDEYSKVGPYDGLSMAVLCRKCAETHEVIIRPKGRDGD